MDFGLTLWKEQYTQSDNDQWVFLPFLMELRLMTVSKPTQLGLQLDKNVHWEDSWRWNVCNAEKNHRDNGVTYLPEGGFHKANENSTLRLFESNGEYRDTYHDIHEFEIMAGTEIRKTVRNFIAQDMALTVNTDHKAHSSGRAKLLTCIRKPIQKMRMYRHSPLFRILCWIAIQWVEVSVWWFRFVWVDKKYRYLPLYSVSGLWRLSKNRLWRAMDR